MASHHEMLAHNADQIGVSSRDNITSIASEPTHTKVITEQAVVQSHIMTVIEHVGADHEGAISPAMRKRLPLMISHAVNSGAFGAYIATNVERVTEQAENYRDWFGNSERWNYPSELLLEGNREILKGTLETYGRLLDDELQKAENTGGFFKGNDAYSQFLNHHLRQYVTQNKHDAETLALLLTDESVKTKTDYSKAGGVVVEQKTPIVLQPKREGNAYPYIIREGMSGVHRTKEQFQYNLANEDEVRVADSGIASMLRTIDDASSFNELRKDAIPVISRALASGAVEEVERTYPQRVAKLAKEYTYWLGGKKGKGGVSGAARIAYAGNREMVAGVLRTYANNLLTSTENPDSLDDEISRERRMAIDLSDAIFTPKKPYTDGQDFDQASTEQPQRVEQSSSDQKLLPVEEVIIDFSTNEGMVILKNRLEARREANNGSAADLPYDDKDDHIYVSLTNAEFNQFVNGDKQSAI